MRLSLVIAFAAVAACSSTADEEAAGTTVAETQPVVTTELATTATTVVPDCSSLTSGQRAIDVGGVTRTYDLYLPDDLGAGASPVMVLFHGWSGSSMEIARKTALGSMAPAAGVVLAVPQGIDSPPTWHFLDESFGDSAFVDAMLAELRTSPCVSSSSTWLVGFSAGSAFAGVYGCSRAVEITGITLVSGLPPPICPDGNSPTIQITHGIADPLVLFDGGTQGAVQLDSVPVSAAGWAARADCPMPPAEQSIGTNPINHVTLWSGCARAGTVSLVAIDGLGHAWPSDPDPPPGQGVADPIVDPGCVALRTVLSMVGDVAGVFEGCLR